MAKGARQPAPSGETISRFLLLLSGGRWRIRCEGETHGPYLSRRGAFLDAVDAAHAVGATGGRAEVVDITPKGGDVVLWRSGRDAYPPA